PEETEESKKVGETVKAKFDKAPKWISDRPVTIVHNGVPVTGYIMLAPIESVTPSHNPLKGFVSSEGYPTDDEGRNVNTTDYTDPEVQEDVKTIGTGVHQSAIDNPPFVDLNGVVFNGNGRTQGLIIAAANKTDAHQPLKEYDDELHNRLGDAGKASMLAGATEADFKHVATGGTPGVFLLASR